MTADGVPTRAPGVIACAVSMIVISTVAVALRFWSRMVATRLRFWLDDWAMLVTLVFSHVFLALNIYWTTVGLGLHAWNIPLDDITPSAVANRVALVFYASVIFLIKISALLMYARIFKIELKFVITLWVVGAVNAIWWIIQLIVPWMFCNPVQKDVNPFLPGTCSAASPWYLGSACINAFFDLIILILPVPVVWSMQMAVSKRISVIIIFVLGYSSAFLSFARFIIIARDPNILSAGSATADPSWDLVPLLYLSMLEAPFAILALCGPSIGQLVNRAVKYRSLSSLFTTKQLDTPLVLDASGSGVSSNRGPNSFSKIGSQNKANNKSNSSWGFGSRNDDSMVTSTITANEDGREIPLNSYYAK